MKNVIVVNDLHSNLLSVTRLMNSGCEVAFSEDKVSVTDSLTRKPIFYGQRKENLY